MKARRSALRKSRHEYLKEKSSKYFDEIALQHTVISEPEKCYKIVLPELEKYEGGRLADLGCGTGRMLSEILEKYGDRFELSGMDLSPQSLKRAKDACGDAVSLKLGDVENLPYEAESFDLLLCMHSFHHYPKPLKALEEMRRVLKPGGTLYLVENDYRPWSRRWINVKLFLRRYPAGDIRMYSQKKLYAMAKKAGFEGPEPVHIAHHSQLLELTRP